MSCTNIPICSLPMTIKGVTFKNRVFASPITTNRIVDHGYPTPRASMSMRPSPGAAFAEVTVTEFYRSRLFLAP